MSYDRKRVEDKSLSNLPALEGKHQFCSLFYDASMANCEFGAVNYLSHLFIICSRSEISPKSCQIIEKN